MLITTILHRPYVFLFLLSYIYIAKRTTNWRWMLAYLLAGYTIAFLSEFLSINHGFPYGWYSYKYENLAGEWLNHGVPVWDSMSYVFMCFAGLYFAQFILRAAASSQSRPLARPPRRTVALIALSALLTTLLDVVIDPVTLQGHRWFLGRVYEYPHHGLYFGVPLTNFAGWFLVSFVVNSVGILVLKFNRIANITQANTLLALGLYFGLMLFGLAIAVYLRMWKLILCDVLLISCLLFFALRSFRFKE